MCRRFRVRTLLSLALFIALTGCNPPRSAPTPTPEPTVTASLVPPGATATTAPTITPAATATVTALPLGVYDERVEQVTLQSETLGVSKTFYVYTPPGYENDTEVRYPVLYLFRGHEREWINIQEDASRRGRNVLDVYEELLGAGEVGPMILVFPGISSDDNSVMGILTNFVAPEKADKAGVGSGRFHDYLIEEMMPYVDTTYRTIPDRTGRGVDGFSMGGFMAAKIALQHPDLFASAGAFDGLYFYSDDSCQIDVERDRVFDYILFDPAFGRPRDVAFASANNPPTLACASAPDAVQSIAWFVQYGPENLEPNSNFFRGDHFIEQLEAKGATNGIDPILGGGHTWYNADEHMKLTLPLHWQVLAQGEMALP